MRRRSGVALIAALMLLSLLALMTAGGFAAAVAVRRAGSAARAQAAVMTDADGAIGSVVANWFPLGLSQLALGQTATQVMAGSNATSDSVSITRLPSNVFWIVASASTDFPERARRRENLILRLPPLRTAPGAAFTSMGNVGVGAAVKLDRDTAVQAGVPCGNSGANVMLAPGASLFAEPGGSIASIVSSNQTAAGDTTTYELLPQGWSSFVARRSTSYQPGARVTLTTQPILYGTGDLVVDGGSGQGLLLVQGNLTIDGPTQFRGLIVARGGITITAATDVTGAVMSVGSGSVVSLQNVSIHYSACAVAAVVAAASAPRPAVGRSWVEMF